jgi:hypothetical protein
MKMKVKVSTNYINHTITKKNSYQIECHNIISCICTNITRVRVRTPHKHLLHTNS